VADVADALAGQWPAAGGPPPGGLVAWIVGVGAVEGTGGALARRFARGGMHVVVTGRTPEKLEAVVKAVQASGGEASYVAADATSEESLLNALEHVDGAGRLGVAVYNAGGAQSKKSVLDMDAAFVEGVWRINCLGGLVVGREAARRMGGVGGVILLTGSKSTNTARPRQAAYAIAKYGLRAVAEALAREFGPQGVHVATVIPDGPIDGERMRAAYPDAKSVRGPDSMISIDAIAETYWQLAIQPRTAWTHSMDLRPWNEPLQ
jgi:NAD(P)-dependent dehydrogenase (short-subunit alcohol dehydrogenase family)